jgi:hypothetical protein
VPQPTAPLRAPIQDRMVEKLLEDIRKRGNGQQEMEMVKMKKKRDWRLYVLQAI